MVGNYLKKKWVIKSQRRMKKKYSYSNGNAISFIVILTSEFYLIVPAIWESHLWFTQSKEMLYNWIIKRHYCYYTYIQAYNKNTSQHLNLENIHLYTYNLTVSQLGKTSKFFDTSIIRTSLTKLPKSISNQTTFTQIT